MATWRVCSPQAFLLLLVWFAFDCNDFGANRALTIVYSTEIRGTNQWGAHRQWTSRPLQHHRRRQGTAISTIQQDGSELGLLDGIMWSFPHTCFSYISIHCKKKKVGYLGIELAITRCDYENQRARNEIILSNIASWLTILIVNEGSNNWGVRAAMYMNIHVVHFHLVYIFWNFDILHLEPSFLFYLTKRFKNSFCFIFDITLSNILKNSYITVVMNWTLSK